MSTFIVSNASPSAPPADLPFVEKDNAIVRGVTLGMYDLSNPASYSGSGNVVHGTLIASLVAGGAPATVVAGSSAGHYFPPAINGTLRTAGGLFGTGAGSVSLPVDFCQPAGASRCLTVIWARMPKTGWIANQMYGLWNVGASLANSALNQHGVYWLTDAGGVINQLRYRLSNQAAAQTDLNMTAGASLDLFCNGNLHQMGFAFESSGGLAKASIWIDKTKVAESASFSATSLNQPATKTGSAFSGGGVGTATKDNAALDLRFGRPSAHNLSSRPDLSILDMLQRDWDGAQGYLS